MDGRNDQKKTYKVGSGAEEYSETTHEILIERSAEADRENAGAFSRQLSMVVKQRHQCS